MFKVNIHEAKAKLSEFIEAVERGERVVICRRNRPVAELRAIAATRTATRPLGASVPAFDVPASFFAPLPDDLLDDFDGTAEPAPGHRRPPRDRRLRTVGSPPGGDADPADEAPAGYVHIPVDRRQAVGALTSGA
jgi:prevent-host-death family protein